MINYKPLRDLVLVEKLEADKTEGGIILPDTRGIRFIRLKVLAVGSGVNEDITMTYPEKVVLAENMFEQLNKENPLIGLILDKYIVAIEERGENGKY